MEGSLSVSGFHATVKLSKLISFLICSPTLLPTLPPSPTPSAVTFTVECHLNMTLPLSSGYPHLMFIPIGLARTLEASELEASNRCSDRAVNPVLSSSKSLGAQTESSPVDFTSTVPITYLG